MPRWTARLLAGLLVLLAIASWLLTWDDYSAPGTAVLGGYGNQSFCTNVLLSYGALVAVLAVFRHPSRSTVFKVAAVHLGAILGLIVLELTAVVGFVDFSKVLAPDPMDGKVSDPRLRWQSKPDAHFVGEILPDLVEVLGADASPIRVDYRTDRFGLRNPNGKGDPRIVFLGDSFLAAVLLPVEKAVSQLVEAKVEATVMNVSEVGYSPQEELARLDSTGVDLHGRLVVQFVFAGNDLLDSFYWREWRARYLKSSWPDTALLKAVLKLLERPRRAAGGRRTGLFETKDGSRVRVYFFYEDAGWKVSAGELKNLERVFSGAQKDIEGRGGRYAVAFIPIKLAVLRSYCTFPPRSVIADVPKDTSLVDSLRAFCDREGIPFLDLQPALERVAASRTVPYFPADTHLNEAGHEAVAEALVPWLRALLATSGKPPIRSTATTPP